MLSLFSLWLAGRIGLLTGPPALAMLVDVAFLPVLAAVLAVPIWRARNVRNLFVPVILLLLAIANGAFHLAHRDASSALTAAIAIRVATSAWIANISNRLPG